MGRVVMVQVTRGRMARGTGGVVGPVPLGWGPGGAPGGAGAIVHGRLAPMPALSYGRWDRGCRQSRLSARPTLVSLLASAACWAAHGRGAARRVLGGGVGGQQERRWPGRVVDPLPDIAGAVRGVDRADIDGSPDFVVPLEGVGEGAAVLPDLKGRLIGVDVARAAQATAVEAAVGIEDEDSDRRPGARRLWGYGWCVGVSGVVGEGLIHEVGAARHSDLLHVQV